MGRKNKLKRFADMKEFPNVVEPELDEIFKKDHRLKGKWSADFFKNDRPLVLELGCGKGEYTVKQAERDPGRNHIGVDIKGARMWVGAKEALKQNLDNAAFLRTRIEFIDSFFAKDEVEEIWITFPDPQLHKNRIKKRLTAPGFLTMYSKFLKPDGTVHLKTDNQVLHEYTLEVIAEENYDLHFATNDLYGKGWPDFSEEEQELLSVTTFYEKKFLEEDMKITYLKFSLNRK